MPCLKCKNDTFFLVCVEFNYTPGDNAGFSKDGSVIKRNDDFKNPLRKKS